jgi:hypothetical protein
VDPVALESAPNAARCIRNRIFNGLKAGKEVKREIRGAGRGLAPSIADVH